MSKKGDYKIPFDKAGNQLHYPDKSGGLYWRDNVEFDATLLYRTFYRGRSAAYMEFWRLDTSTTVIVFLGDFEPFIFNMVGGKVTGRWTFCKRGQNYGCRLADVQPTEKA